MDLLCILAGATLAGVGFMYLGDFGTLLGWCGVAMLVYGLVINHRRHQGLKAEKAPIGAVPGPQIAAADPNTALASLVKMKDDGLITDSEFESKKAEILQRL